MKKLIMRMYGVACILFVFLFVYGLANLRLSIDRTNALREYTDFSGYSISEVKDASAPMGVKKVIRFRLKEIGGDYNDLVFLSKYQDVTVTIGNRIVYELKSDGAMYSPKSPGVVYNDVVLRDEYNLREVMIELVPYYQGFNPTPRIKLGDRSRIVSGIVYENLPIIFLCAIVIVMGCIRLCVTVMNRKNESFPFWASLCHSVCIILVGLWKAFDSDIFALVARETPIFPLLGFLIYMTLPLMITKMVRDQMTVEKSKPFFVADAITMVGILSMIVLQFLGKLDLWEGIWISRASLAISFLCIFLVIYREVNENGWTKNNVTGAVVTMFALVWVIVDIVTYYVAGGVTEAPFGMLLFAIFLTVLMVNRVQISKKGMDEGMQAVQYKKLAFHDALTGFYNRAAFAEHLAGADFVPERNIMLAFDLNNLKKCNDELGHDKGDLYIKEAARIIMDCFGEGGRCYRLGGDEFSAILSKPDVADCEKRIHLMRERVERFNRASEDIHMGIACGYAIYDPREDEDIHATIRRADKMMYEVKFAMKQKEASEKAGQN